MWPAEPAAEQLPWAGVQTTVETNSRSVALLSRPRQRSRQVLGREIAYLRQHNTASNLQQQLTRCVGAEGGKTRQRLHRRGSTGLSKRGKHTAGSGSHWLGCAVGCRAYIKIVQRGQASPQHDYTAAVVCWTKAAAGQAVEWMGEDTLEGHQHDLAATVQARTGNGWRSDMWWGFTDWGPSRCAAGG
jgi:hypothetical protein